MSEVSTGQSAAEGEHAAPAASVSDGAILRVENLVKHFPIRKGLQLIVRVCKCLVYHISSN